MNGPKLASASIADSLPAATVLRGSCVVFLADGTTEKNIDEIARMHEAIPPGVNTRIGVSVLTPPKVADLIGARIESISI